MKTIEVTHKGVTIKIKQVTTLKSGVAYTEHQIIDYSTGKRVRHSRATLPDAKAKVWFRNHHFLDRLKILSIKKCSCYVIG